MSNSRNRQNYNLLDLTNISSIITTYVFTPLGNIINGDNFIENINDLSFMDEKLKKRINQIFNGDIVTDIKNVSYNKKIIIYAQSLLVDNFKLGLLIIINNSFIIKDKADSYKLRMLMEDLSKVTTICIDSTDDLDSFNSISVAIGRALNANEGYILKITSEDELNIKYSYPDNIKLPEEYNIYLHKYINSLNNYKILVNWPRNKYVSIPIHLDNYLWGIIVIKKESSNWEILELNFLNSLARVIGSIIGRMTMQKALEHSERKYRTLVESQADMVFTVDLKGMITYANNVCTELTGYENKQLLHKNIIDFVLPEQIYILKYNLNKRFNNENLAPYSLDIKTKYGSLIPIEVHTSLITNNENNTKEFLVVARDIRERKRLEEALRDSEFRYRTYIENTPDAVYALDELGYITFVNTATTYLTGYTKSELIGMHVNQIISPSHIKEVNKNIELRRQGIPTPNEYEIEIITKDGRIVPVEVRPAPLLDSNKNPIGTLAIGRDISERKKAQNQLIYLSEHDALTDLYNRKYFEKQIEQLKESELYPIAIIIMDINGLKLINDTLGHQSGDILIKTIGSIINKATNSEYIAARIGGDEFAIIMPGADREQVDEFKELIQSQINFFNENNKEGLFLSVALGSCICENSQHDLSITVKNADNAMYRSKLFEHRSARHTILKTLESTLSVRDQMTEEHATRLKDLVVGFGKKLGLTREDLDNLALLAVTHDIGKIGVPDEILFKQGPLDEYEWEIMKSHCEIGYRIAKESTELSGIAEYILYHHEYWDGNGYPLKLKATEIPIICRILAVIDAYDAMINDRPYRKAIPKHEAIKEIIADRGKKFDPSIVDEFIEYIKTT